MCGQSIAYNIYATLGHTNPLFMGFLGYQNVNKEIIQPNIEKEQQTPKIQYFRGFLYFGDSGIRKGRHFMILKCPLMIVTVLVILVLTLFVWLCTGLIYISGLVLGLFSTVIALLGVAVLLTYSPQNGVILLVMAFLISPMGLPLAAIWLMGKVQSLKFAIQELVYG